MIPSITPVADSYLVLSERNLHSHLSSDILIVLETVQFVPLIDRVVVPQYRLELHRAQKVVVRRGPVIHIQSQLGVLPRDVAIFEDVSACVRSVIQNRTPGFTYNVTSCFHVGLWDDGLPNSVPGDVPGVDVEEVEEEPAADDAIVDFVEPPDDGVDPGCLAAFLAAAASSACLARKEIAPRACAACELVRSTGAGVGAPLRVGPRSGIGSRETNSLCSNSATT
jgi:hypothetical protein